jgi:thiamine kinase-like enzyme
MVKDAENLKDYHVSRGRFSRTLASAIGTALSTLHRIEKDKTKHRESEIAFSTQPPWILSIHLPSVQVFRDFSGTSIELIKIIQSFTAFGELFDELRWSWQAKSLIHSDIKWDNCIAYSSSPSGRKTKIKIVDWELASLGDPCWDIGSVFSEYLSFWLLSIPISGETPPERFPELAQFPLERMQSAIRRFWQSYRKQMELDDIKSQELLVRAVQYGAARLVQTAIEQMQISIQLTGNSICFLQLSLNILQRPKEAVVHLLGITSE